MEQERDDIRQEPEYSAQPQEGYQPRPAWQVWAARIGLVLFLLIVVYQLLSIAGGGL